MTEEKKYKHIIPNECIYCLYQIWLPWTYDKSDLDHIEFEGLMGWCNLHKEDCYKLTGKCEFILGYEAFQEMRKSWVKKNGSV